MAEDAVTQEDVERMLRGFALHNQGDFDALREFVAPHIVVERPGGQPPLVGWDALRSNLDPDAFAWQTIEPVETSIHGDRIFQRVRIRSMGAGSGLELESEGWFIWTVENGLAVRLTAFTSEAEAKARL